MSALDLLARLRALGVKIGVDGDDLLVDAPQGVVTPELAAEIRERKVQIVAMLKWSSRSKHSAELPLEPADRSQPLPLSYAQQRLWFLDQLEPGSAAYNISWTVRLKGELNIPALQRSIDTLIARHEVLRCSFSASQGEAETVVHEQVCAELEQSDLPAAGDERMRAHLSKLAASPFNLAEPPLIRFFLVKRSETEHVLLVLIHHIISDGASMRILFRELAACYDAYTHNETPEFEPLAVQYPDYAVWQRNWLEGEQLEQQLDYWLNKLDGAPPVLTLPADRPRSAALRFRGASVVRLLPRSLAEELRAFGRTSGATLFMVMLAAFDVLLARYSGQKDLVVGTPIGGRPRTALEGLIGFFVNTAVLRINIDENTSFRDLVRQVRDTALEMHTNQELPFEKLVEVLQPERELSHTPVFQVMFDLQEEPRWKLPVRDLEVIPEVIFSSRTSTFDLTLSVREAENGLDAMFEYDTDLFDESTIERFALHYQNLLEAALANPDQAMSELSMLDDNERHKVLFELNPAGDIEPEATLTGLFTRSVAEHPAGIAVESAGQGISYAVLDEQSGRVAGALTDNGVQPGDVVGLYAGRSAGTVAAMLGVLKAGAAWLPLDPDYPPERLRAMVDQVRPALVLVEEGLRPLFNASHLVLDRELLDAGPVAKTVFVDASALACVLFTSGSTGVPKAVRLPHTGLANYVEALRRKTALHTGARVLQFASLNFDISIEETFVAFAAGATLVLRETGPAPDALSFMRFIGEQRISWMSLPTAYWHELSTLEGEVRNTALQTVVIGGEKAQLEHWRVWRTQFPQVQLLNTYGPTETSIVATWYDLTHQQPHERGQDGLSFIPIGSPVPNVQIYILNARRQPQAVGVPGELYIGGAGVAQGYIDATAEATVFNDNPFGPGRLYKTGDRARWLADGNIEYLGRIDEQLKLRGHRVEPAEIEAALLSHPLLDTCVVIPVSYGDEAAHISLAAYVAAPEQQPSALELRNWLQARLPDYMVPDTYMVLDTLPLTVNGKVDKAALPAVQKQRLSRTEFVAPETETEQQVAAIWAEVLGIAAVGLRDNFFELGGHSLLATKVMARIRDVLRKDVPLRALFNSPTVAGLADAITRSSAEYGQPVKPRRDAELPPLSFSQQRLWFLDQLEPGSAGFNLPWTARLTGPLNKPALQSALNSLVARHEVLRTSFAAIEGEAVQIVAASGRIALQEELHLGAGNEQLNRRLQKIIAEGFDLQQGPLMRAVLLQVGDEDHVLLLVMHHIVSDGWSMGVVYRELSALYNAAVNGTAASLDPLPVQYADYAIWQQARSAEFDRQLDYWREQLAGLPPLLELVYDKPRPVQQSYRGGWQELTLDSQLSTALRDLATGHDASLFMVLLAVFNVLLGRYAGREDIVIGTPVAGRQRTELEGLIGFFLNTLVIRSSLSGNPGFADYLERVRLAAVAAFDHQDVPFERLIEALQPVRNPAYPPVVQVMFNVHNEAAGQVEFDSVAVQPFSVASGIAKFDLNVSVFETADGCLRLGMEYSSDLFDADSIVRMLGEYETLLQAVVAKPDAPLCELPLPGGVRSVGTGPAYLSAHESGQTVATRFVKQAQSTPDAPAIDDGQQVLSYAELLNRAAQQSAKLPAEAERVALLFNPGIDSVVAMLAVALAAKTWVAIDPKQPAARIQAIVDETDCLWVAEDCTDVAADLECHILYSGRGGSESEPNAGTPAESVAGELAYILFTSGTTGKPKGVMQTHAGLLAHIDAYAASIEIRSSDRISLLASYAFDAALMDIFGALLNGACLCPVDLLATDQPLAELAASKVTVLHATPTVFRILMNAAGSMLTTVRAVVLGGEAADAGDFDLFCRHFSGETIFVNGLGPSESTTALQFKTDAHSELPWGLLPVGTAVAGTEVWLQDNDGNPAAFSGEIVIRSNRLSPGYWSNATETAGAAVFRDGVYYSGDHARWLPDGNLLFTGRGDGQVKLRGQRIETAGIETLLTELPGATAAVVRLVDFRGMPELVCWYVPGADADTNSFTLTDKSLRDSLRRDLPESQIPAVFVQVDTLPLLANGKLNVQALPAPEPVSAGDYEAPRSDREQAIAAIWQEVLEADRIGREDDFFALGGHSLLATRVIARVREQLKSDVSLRSLFLHPVLAEFAAATLSETIADELPLVRQDDVRRTLAPLSWSQQRLWFLDQLEPGNPAWNLHRAMRIRGAFDTGRLQQALNQLVQRHESLRTGFAARNAEPVQIVSPAAPLTLEQIDLFGAGEDFLRNRCLELVRQPFELQNGSLFRAVLIRVAEDDVILLLIMHHIISDGWSMGVISDDLGRLYRDSEAELPPITVHYRDYAIWQRDWLSGAAPESQLDYWRVQLADVPPVLELPLDSPRPVVPAHRGAWVQRRLSNRQLQSLQQLSQAHNATLFMTLLAVFNIVLARYSGREDIVVGTPVAGRQRTELEPLVGYFLNTLVLRSDLSGNPGVAELIGRVKQTALGAYENQDLPFEKLIEALQPARSLAVAPLVQVMFNLHNEFDRSFDIDADAGTDVGSFHLDRGTSKFDLSVSAVEGRDGLLLAVEYDTDIFKSQTIGLFLDHYVLLLDAAVSDPLQTLDDLPRPACVSGISQQLVEKQLAVLPEESASTVLEAFGLQVQQNPDAPAVITGPVTLTYRELQQRANHLSYELIGVAGDGCERVGLLLGHDAFMPVGLLGALQAGLAYVPLDPEAPVERLSGIVKDAQLSALVAAPQFFELAEDLARGADGNLPLLLIDESEAAHSETVPDVSIDADAMAYILFTSGSTGTPKGVVQSHRNLLQHARTYQRSLGISANDQLSLLSPYGFDAAVMDIYASLISGAALCPFDLKNEAFIGAVIGEIAASDITILHATPTVFRYLMRHKICRHDVTKVRAVVLGGEAATSYDFEFFRKNFDESAIFVNGLGPSECTLALQWFANHQTELGGGVVPVGYPVSGVDVLLLDEQLSVSSIAGEIALCCDALTPGYWNDTALNEQAFITIDGRRWYRSGDLGRYLPDGTLMFNGRRDEQIKLRGHRIEPGEIEAVLTNHERVDRAVVMLRDDLQSNPRLVAWVVAKKKMTVEAGELREYLKNHLPRYMMPSAIEVLDGLPLTSNGKVDRRALPDPKWGRNEDLVYVAPRSDTEKQLAVIWSEVLGVGKVGVHDDFFDLGGHSLLAMQLMSRVSDSLNVGLPLRKLFDGPTVADVAQAIDDVRWSVGADK